MESVGLHVRSLPPQCRRSWLSPSAARPASLQRRRSTVPSWPSPLASGAPPATSATLHPTTSSLFTQGRLGCAVGVSSVCYRFGTDRYVACAIRAKLASMGFLQSTFSLLIGLVFTRTANPDDIVIESLSMRQKPLGADEGDAATCDEGPDFHELDKNLQETFHNYLELRGITPTATKLLHEYMISKDRRVLPKTASKDKRNNLVFLTRLCNFLKKD
ncbi:hypothetical protein ACQ4PT_003580 [Festuca glaucescens]